MGGEEQWDTIERKTLPDLLRRNVNHLLRGHATEAVINLVYRKATKNLKNKYDQLTAVAGGFEPDGKTQAQTPIAFVVKSCLEACLKSVEDIVRDDTTLMLSRESFIKTVKPQLVLFMA